PRPWNSRRERGKSLRSLLYDEGRWNWSWSFGSPPDHSAAWRCHHGRKERGPWNDFFGDDSLPPQERSLSQRRILVVDDDESLRRVTQVQLQQSGYDVAAACDGSEALSALERFPAD